MHRVIAGLAAAGVAGSTFWLALRTPARALCASPGQMSGGGANHWLVVTVNREPDRLTAGTGRLPAPITNVADQAEVRVQPAPGGRGTELGLRLIEPPPTGLAGAIARLLGTDPRQSLRSALRDAKSLIETGEVIQPGESGSSHPTATCRLFDMALRVAGGVGRL